MSSTTKKALKELRDDTGFLRELVQQVNSYDGSLEGYAAYDFDDDFFDTYFEGKPMEAVRATFFGNVQNWSDEYIRFNGYGNLESLSDYRYDKELQAAADEIITEAERLTDEIDLPEIIERYISRTAPACPLCGAAEITANCNNGGCS